MDSRMAAPTVERLERTRQFFVHSLVLAILTLLAALAAAVWNPNATFPLAILTAGEAVVVMCAYYAQHDLIQGLALEREAWQIPAVRRYREWLLKQPVRDRLAASINSLIADANTPYAFCLADRVALVEDQLRVLALELATPEIPVQPRSLIVCLRLLSHGVESPLFNPGVPIEQLQATLMRIRIGIGRRAAG
jgi:hypothetical protein